MELSLAHYIVIILLAYPFMKKIEQAEQAIHYDLMEGACTLSKKPEDDKYSVKDYYLHPYYAYQMWKIIFEVIFEEKKQKNP